MLKTFSVKNRNAVELERQFNDWESENRGIEITGTYVVMSGSIIQLFVFYKLAR